MFILPAPVHAVAVPAVPRLPWSLSLGQTTTPASTLTLLALLSATLLLSLLIRFVLVRSSLAARLRLKATSPVPVAEKIVPGDSESEDAPKASEEKKSASWLATLSYSLPIALDQRAATPPPMRGRHVYRGGRGVGFVQPQPRRPEAALAMRQMVEAPLPAIYECQTPASMAKMIMSRHTYRRASPPPPRARAAPKMSYTLRRPEGAPSGFVEEGVEEVEAGETNV
ncbi:hypothetical protein R3P38DRAFT_2891660 [Favolaschia claudopus]|uniref:Uncharacterized protein n=1 Tax=Favolaschia claudopus TaxID=2862362 RepID=A0AAW0CU88_9AGAR